MVKRSSKQIGARSSGRISLSRRFLLAVLIITGASVIGLVAVPAVFPDTGAVMADALRSVVGPEPVSALESVVFKVQDVFNRAEFQATGKAQEVDWVSPARPAQVPAPAPAVPKPTALNSTMSVGPIEATATPESSSSVMTATAEPSIPSDVQPSVPTSTRITQESVVSALPTVEGGWQAFGPSATSGLPIMSRGIVKPDPSRPFVRTAVIRIDLDHAQLHLVAGTKEPAFAKGVPPFARPGSIPNPDISPDILLAAFNGGFKAEHGHYGMMVNEQIILPPLDGIATVGLYRDGHIQMGAWGQEVTRTQDLVAFRQNCALLVQQGQVRPNIDNTDLLTWGFTGKSSPSATWRSGLGLSQDGRFLIYVVGQSLTAQTLAVALQQAGAYYGMQLDINGGYTRFATYTPSNSSHAALPMRAEMLLKDMRRTAQQFLAPYSRDFFYVTASQHYSRSTCGRNKQMILIGVTRDVTG